MKKLSLLLISALVAIAANATVGVTFEIGDLAYKVTQDPTSSAHGQVTVTGLSANGKTKSSLSLTIPTSVSYNSKTHLVKSVANSAFASQSNLTGVTINYGITDLNASAFYNCANITFANIPSSCRYIYSKVFVGCTKLTTVRYALTTDPNDGANIINSDAFPTNSGMTLYVTMTNPDAVAQFQKKAAFKNFATIKKHSSARDVLCSDGAYLVVTKAPTYSSNGEMTMTGFSSTASAVTDGAYKKNGATYSFGPYTYNFVAIADSAMLDNTTLKSVNITGCTKLTSIGVCAFKNCTSLTSVSLNEGLTTISSSSFYGCTGLTVINIPASVTSCSAYFVDHCSALTNISVDTNNKNYSSYNGSFYNKAKTYLLRCPEGATYTSIHPDTKTIGSYAFENCKKLLNIYIPYGVTTINIQAFSGCSEVTDARIPSSVAYMDKQAFMGCTKLANLYVNNNTPLAMVASSFSECKRTNLYVPQSAVDAYKAAEGWKTWSNIKRGGHDLQLSSILSTSYNVLCFYSITSAAAETINGTSYAGRASLVNVPSVQDAATLYIPAHITINNKNYAVTSVGPYASDGANFGGEFTINLGANVDTIGEAAFKNHTNIKTLNLNTNLKVVSKDAFNGCRIANDLIFPYGFKYLGNYAFYDNSMKRILLPSSFGSMGRAAIAKNNHLEELIVNTGWLSVYTNWDLTNIPSSCKLYVPTNYVGHYKNNSMWKALTVSAGAYDFAHNNNHSGSAYRMTVVSNSSVTKDGTTYAGKAKYVYHPYIKTQSGQFAASNYETDMTNGGSKKYLMTQIGDSLLVDATNRTGINISSMKYLDRIGAYAFMKSGLSGTFTVPSTCSYIGRYAFVSCPNLHELVINIPENGISWGGQFYGADAADFTCYVSWYSVPDYQKSITNWTQFSTDSKAPIDRLNGYFVTSGDETVYDFAVNHPVDWNATGLTAYTIYSYQKSEQKAYAQMVNQTPANTGLLIEGFKKNTIHKLKRPSGTPSTPQNLLIGTGDGTSPNIYNESVGFYFSPTSKAFHRPTSTYYTTGKGRSYLKLSSTLAGSTSKITVDIFAATGDVDGNGVVNVSDVSALINKLLGLVSYSDSVCDIDGNGTVNVSDVTALINILLAM